MDPWYTRRDANSGGTGQGREMRKRRFVLKRKEVVLCYVNAPSPDEDGECDHLSTYTYTSYLCIMYIYVCI